MLPVRMLTVGLHMLVSLVAITPAAAAHADIHVADLHNAELHAADLRDDTKVASTYEEAACDPSDSGECALEIDLSVPSAPAILDCNDARTSLILADMIGTCDMPRRAHATLAPPTLHTAGSAPSARMSDGPRGADSCPLRPPSRGDDSPSIVTRRAPLEPALIISSLVLDLSTPSLRAEDLRLERPPRA